MGTDLLVFALYGVVTVALAWVLSGYMHRVYAGERVLLSPVLAPVERAFYAAAGTEPDRAQGWMAYALAVLAFNLAGFVLLFTILRLQGVTPWNPAAIPPMAPDLAFNTAISFVTNTNWQAYGGEGELSNFSQMVGLGVQNFVSAATGMAVAVAVIRGFVARGTGRLGNFWVDLTRTVLYVLLPLSILMAILLISQGVPQTLADYARATTLQGAEQVIARGPAASQIAIKQLGTNGGGFFAVNSAHPLENPTILSNMVQSVTILLIPIAFCFLFGRMVLDHRQGLAIFAAMGILFIAGLGVIHAQELAGNPLLATEAGVTGGNMEGKEQRFGVALSSLWAQATTAASNGSVNAMHQSFLPLSGLVMLLNIQTGQVIFGGVGVGLYAMLLYVVLAVFLAGLMVGRTPEYLGKRVEGREVTLAVIALLVMPVGVLGLGGLAALFAGAEGMGPQGLTQILYAYASATGNNGSAFAGFPADRPFHTTAQGIAMMLGRYGIALAALAVAGAMAARRPALPGAGSLPTHGPLFVVLLILTVVVLGALSFLPVLLLGPVADHLALRAGQSF